MGPLNHSSIIYEGTKKSKCIFSFDVWRHSQVHYGFLAALLAAAVANQCIKVQWRVTRARDHTVLVGAASCGWPGLPDHIAVRTAICSPRREKQREREREVTQSTANNETSRPSSRRCSCDCPAPLSVTSLPSVISLTTIRHLADGTTPRRKVAEDQS